MEYTNFKKVIVFIILVIAIYLLLAFRLLIALIIAGLAIWFFWPQISKYWT